MDRFRFALVDSENYGSDIYMTIIVQMKKWWGWKTIKTLEGEYPEVYKKAGKATEILNS